MCPISAATTDVVEGFFVILGVRWTARQATTGNLGRDFLSREEEQEGEEVLGRGVCGVGMAEAVLGGRQKGGGAEEGRRKP